MSESPYRVHGTEIPPMLGRERLYERLCRHLTKATPDHVSVIGPRLFGKSVLLKHLASHFRHDGFVSTLYWDLRFGTPRSDSEFRTRFARHLKKCLESTRPDLAEWLEPDEEEAADTLMAVCDELGTGRVRVLAVLDGFDHLLGGFGITRNLWDELRTLTQKGGLCLVTGSRARLYDLCRDEESRTSNFWQIFHDPFQVGVFDDGDWPGFLEPLTSTGVHLDESARKEIRNWTGCVPVLAAALARHLFSGHRTGETISKPEVDRVASKMVEDPPDVVRALWDDCSIDLQSLLVEISAGSVRESAVPKRRRRELLDRGYVRESRRGLLPACRLMNAYARRRNTEVTYLNQLFGTSDSFSDNVRGMLELRLKGIAGRVDPKLAGFVEKAVRDLHPNPDAAVVWMRSVAETALDLIWKAELGESDSLPDEWRSLYDPGKAQELLPTKRGQQCYLLRLVTGTDKHRRIARSVTKPTYILVDHIQSVGDFGQHREGQDVSLATAASFCLSAIEVCERLAEELPRNVR